MQAQQKADTHICKMKWEKLSSTTHKAIGVHGLFEIKESRSQGKRKFWAKYFGNTGKQFCMPPFDSLKSAKAACEDSWYWE